MIPPKEVIMNTACLRRIFSEIPVKPIDNADSIMKYQRLSIVAESCRAKERIIKTQIDKHTTKRQLNTTVKFTCIIIDNKQKNYVKIKLIKWNR